jgi:hypothetical protein
MWKGTLNDKIKIMEPIGIIVISLNASIAVWQLVEALLEKEEQKSKAHLMAFMGWIIAAIWCFNYFLEFVN